MSQGTSPYKRVFTVGLGLMGVWARCTTALAGQVVAAAAKPMFDSNYIARKNVYHGHTWLIWTNVLMDGSRVLSSAVVFACIWWAARQMRGLPRLRGYYWILSSFGTYMLLTSCTGVMGIVTVWWPVYPVAATLKIFCATASIVAATILVRATPQISQSLKRLINDSLTAETKRRDMEARLEKSEESFRLALLGFDGVGIFEHDLIRDMVLSNETYARYFGIDPDAMVAGVPADQIMLAMPEGDRGAVRAALQECIRSGKPVCVEHRIIDEQQALRWVEVRGECTYDAVGTPVSLFGLLVDISVRKGNEEKLRMIEQQKLEASEALLVSNGRFRLLVEGVNDYALLTLDTNGLLTSWNRGVERLLGYTEAEILGRNFSCIFTPEDIAEGVPERVLERARVNGRSEDEGWRVRANGEQFWASVTKTAFAREGDTASATPEMAREFAVIIHDTTESKKVATALEEASLERYRLQEEFLSHVSHELRTPLTAIYFFTSNVMDGIFGELTPDQRAHLAYTMENAEQLKTMVDDLLDITRVGSTRLSIHAHRVDCGRLIGDAINTCQTNAQGKKISLESVLAPGLGAGLGAGLGTGLGTGLRTGITPATGQARELPYAWADGDRVRQILINLIDNAIKFSPQERSISVSAEVYGPDPGFLHVAVRDQGCGIAPEDMERIFNRLAQVEGRSQSSRSGLGLGLFITKELVQQHGGRIWVESEVEHGSVFHFTLPVFSLTRLCGNLLTRPNLERGSMTLLSIDLDGYEGGWKDILPRLQKVIEACLRPAQDVLLDVTGGHGATVALFVVAFADEVGSAMIARRIEAELKRFDSALRLRSSVWAKTLALTYSRLESGSVDCADDRAIQGAMAQFEHLIQVHLEEPESVS